MTRFLKFKTSHLNVATHQAQSIYVPALIDVLTISASPHSWKIHKRVACGFVRPMHYVYSCHLADCMSFSFICTDTASVCALL